jgi:hypothetical protein
MPDVRVWQNGFAKEDFRQFMDEMDEGGKSLLRRKTHLRYGNRICKDSR